ncbi:MAG: CRISPR-associated protein Csm6 [Clostridiales bacterium]|nr:CRISPR-associated protein Csm6 [Clostridiales bacterium]
MKTKILFSPIGGSDPISNFHDGPMLHILRVYKPDIVYLYLSKEMCDFKEKDDRYNYCIKKLGEKLNHEYQVHVLERTDLVDVQKFDYFVDEFREIITKINSKHEGATLYLNVSSGTPAMKSSLQILSVLSEHRLIPIQVSTPMKQLNPHIEDRENYEVEDYWEANYDNQPDFVNRCVESKGTNLLATIKKEITAKHIDAYDYVAALSIAKDMEEFIDNDVLKLLTAANYRLQLDFSGVYKALNDTKFDILPIKDYKRKIILEYLLYLKIKLIKEEYADFLRATTPYIVEIFELIVQKYCIIDINEYCIKHRNRNGIYINRWDRNKLSNNQKLLNILDNEFPGGIKEMPVASYHLAIIINAYCDNNRIKETVNDLRDAEQLVRNLAAHEMVSVTDQWIKKNTNFTSKQLLDKLKYLAQMSGININDELWNSYDAMNDIIKGLL